MSMAAAKAAAWVYLLAGSGRGTAGRHSTLHALGVHLLDFLLGGGAFAGLIATATDESSLGKDHHQTAGDDDNAYHVFTSLYIIAAGTPAATWFPSDLVDHGKLQR
jgi:hypothetical protein